MYVCAPVVLQARVDSEGGMGDVPGRGAAGAMGLGLFLTITFLTSGSSIHLAELSNLLAGGVIAQGVRSGGLKMLSC